MGGLLLERVQMASLRDKRNGMVILGTRAHLQTNFDANNNTSQLNRIRERQRRKFDCKCDIKTKTKTKPSRTQSASDNLLIWHPKGQIRRRRNWRSFRKIGTQFTKFTIGVIGGETSSVRNKSLSRYHCGRLIFGQLAQGCRFYM